MAQGGVSQKAKSYVSRAVAVFSILSFIEFVSFYLFINFLGDYSNEYIYFIQRVCLFVLLVAAGVAVYRTAKKGLQIITHSLFISATRGIFALPFFYLFFLSYAIYDSIDAIVLALFATIVAVILHAIFTALIAFVIKTVCKKNGMDENEIASPVRFKSPFSGTVLVIALAVGLINFIEAVASIIVSISNSYITPPLGHIIYYVITLIYPILILAGVYFLSILITMCIDKWILRKASKANDEAETKKPMEDLENPNNL